MRGYLGLIILAASVCPGAALAQQSTGIGVGVATSRSTAISGQGGQGGAGGQGGQGGSAQGGTANAQGGVGRGGKAIAIINNGTGAADPNATTHIDQTVTSQGGTTSTLRQTGTQTLKNVPSVFAPGLGSAGIETCLGSISAGASGIGFGATLATTLKDPDCSARLDARTLWSFGLKKAAVARLCLTKEIAQSMSDVCSEYAPWTVQPGEYAKAPVAQAALASASAEPQLDTYNGGPVEVIEHKSGALRLCNDYDVAGHRCRAWAYGHR
jgi:hypothetical protein